MSLICSSKKFWMQKKKKMGKINDRLLSKPVCTVCIHKNIRLSEMLLCCFGSGFFFWLKKETDNILVKFLVYWTFVWNQNCNHVCIQEYLSIYTHTTNKNSYREIFLPSLSLIVWVFLFIFVLSKPQKNLPPCFCFLQWNESLGDSFLR